MHITLKKTAVLKENFNLEDIIKKCKKNNRASQTNLYQMFADKMFGVCLYYSKDYTEAQDILQDGFIKCFEKISQYKGNGSFEGWLRKIFVNTALEKFRKKKLLFTVDDDNSNTLNQLAPVEIEGDVNAKDLLEIIKSLTPQYRIVFNLYSIEGFSHKEISKKLGISVGTSKSNLARARKILQTKVKEKYSFVAEEKIKVL